jgi:hypothetical protein
MTFKNQPLVYCLRTLFVFINYLNSSLGMSFIFNECKQPVNPCPMGISLNKPTGACGAPKRNEIKNINYSITQHLFLNRFIEKANLTVLC